MKSILLSVKPKWCAEIMNGNKTIEIRKKFPADYVGWVYIYCTKDLKSGKQELTCLNKKHLAKVKTITYRGNEMLGKVVARFWCDNVEHFEREYSSRYIDDYYGNNGEPLNKKFYKKTCLTKKELFDYIGSGSGYAIHISKLEIFDKPRELKEFSNCDKYPYTKYIGKAPQNYCYVEGEKN